MNKSDNYSDQEAPILISSFWNQKTLVLKIPRLQSGGQPNTIPDVKNTADIAAFIHLEHTQESCHYQNHNFREVAYKSSHHVPNWSHVISKNARKTVILPKKQKPKFDKMRGRPNESAKRAAELRVSLQGSKITNGAKPSANKRRSLPQLLSVRYSYLSPVWRFIRCLSAIKTGLVSCRVFLRKEWRTEGRAWPSFGPEDARENRCRGCAEIETVE